MAPHGRIAVFSTLLALASLAALAPEARAYTLLFFPLSERTHMLVHLKLATELAERNHTVHVMTAECHLPFAEHVAAEMAAARSPSAPVPTQTWRRSAAALGAAAGRGQQRRHRLHFVPYTLDCERIEAEKAAAQKFNPARTFAAILANVVGRIDTVLGDEELMHQLGGLAPSVDLVVGDLLSYGMMLAAKLGLRHVDLDVGTAGAIWEPLFFGAEPTSSYVPAVGTFFPTDGMSLWQRAANLAINSAVRLFLLWAYWGPGGWLQAVVRRHGVPMAWPYTHPMLLLTNSNFATEPPRSVPPSVKYVGPVLPEPPAPLPPALAEWVDGAGPGGVVVVSFGGTLQAPRESSAALARAMRSMPDVRFVWKLSAGDQAALAAELDGLANAYVAEWVPQNDLLGHRAVRAFVTQGGYLSMAEAAFHGVPLLGLPFIPGQGELIRFAQDQGRARRLPAGALARRGGAEVFAAELRALLDGGSGYREAAGVVAKRLHASPRPYRQLAADWVEYAAALKDHGPFLYPEKVRQPWHQQAMLDVMALYAAAAALPVWLLARWRRQRRRSDDRAGRAAAEELRRLRRRQEEAAAAAARRRGPEVVAEVRLLPPSATAAAAKKVA